ncbi:MAG: hypothetical protein UE295_04460 [Acutalibacteraceae bacterium]|nr:hypothetical protein [Acutalibacteraceae bacterium]
MKEIYEKITIDISVLKLEDVIATSSDVDDEFDDEHDNGYFDWDSFE